MFQRAKSEVQRLKIHQDYTQTSGERPPDPLRFYSKFLISSLPFEIPLLLYYLFRCHAGTKRFILLATWTFLNICKSISEEHDTAQTGT